jgi:Transposase, Mutator family
VTLARPKLRGTTERFASQLFGTGVTKTNALESLVIAGFVRGLSTRDVEATLGETLGESAAVSKSTVSRICAEIKTQFEAWSKRPRHRTNEGWRVGLAVCGAGVDQDGVVVVHLEGRTSPMSYVRHGGDSESAEPPCLGP